MIDKTNVCLKLRKLRSTSLSSEVTVRSGQEVCSEMIVSDFRGGSLGEDVDTGGVDKSPLGLTAACRDHNHGGQYGTKDLCDTIVHNAKWQKSEDLSGDLCEIGGPFNSEASVNIEDVHDDSGEITQSTELMDPYKSVCERADCCSIQTNTETGFGHDISKSSCAKFCPHSFKKERPGRDCIWDCRHQHRKCQRVMHGQQALDEADLVCIKEGKCIVPECYAGEFNVANVFCPHSTRRK